MQWDQAAVAFGGIVLGASLTWLHELWSSRRRVAEDQTRFDRELLAEEARESRRLAAERQTEVRKRADDSAEEALEHLTWLAEHLPKTLAFSSRPQVSQAELQSLGLESVRRLAALDRCALSFPSPLNAHVTWSVRFLNSADQIAEHGVGWPHQVVGWTVAETRELLGAWLRGEDIPSVLPPKLAEALQGYEMYLEFMEEVHERQDEGRQAGRGS